MSVGKNEFIRVSKVDEIGMPHQMTFQGGDALTLSHELYTAWRADPSTVFVGKFTYLGAGKWEKTL